jgi:endonuclease/exonuclease/phosphatase family metal-dependent hydrolase
VTLRLLTYNIRKGGIGREAALAEVIAAAAPDVVLLQEATHPGVVAALAATLGMPAHASRPGASLGFLSRLPVRAFRWIRPRWARHAFIEMVLEPDGVTVIGVHLSAVHSNLTERRRLLELGALLAHAVTAAPRHVLAGDFNTLAPGETLDLRRLPPRLRAITWLTGRRIRWQTIHRVLESGYLDVFRHTAAELPGYTFPTWDPHLRLDYVFTPSSLAGHIVECGPVATPAGIVASDHFPVFAHFEF